MDPKKQHSHHSKEQATSQRREPKIGGREFGQVIEPTQAQMASGNEGLTEKTAKRTEEEKKREKKRKAA